MAPSGTPDAIIAKLNAAAKEASQDKAVIEKLQAQGIEAAWTSVSEMNDLLSSESAHWQKALQKAGVKPE